MPDAGADDHFKTLLERYTIYVIPCPAPDATAECFRKPFYERATNQRRTDDDRDGAVDEDPFEDLNGDGWITMLRIEDPAGPYMPVATEPRVLTKADPKRNQSGRYRLISEGIDNDHDERFNEDPPGGVALNRNFTFHYPTFAAGAGSHAVSEIESRAVADFAFTHPNIALVFCFTPDDNLFEPWKGEKESGKYVNSILPADADALSFIAEQYRTLHGGNHPPEVPKGEGSFVEWAYFHYGRWSLGARGWWIPNTPADAAKKDDEKADDKKQPDAAKADAPKSDAPKAEAEADKKNGDKKDAEKKDTDKKDNEKKLDPAAAELANALRWFDKQGIEGFVPWQPVEHPDFPGKKVEVGGVKPFLLLNPPAKELDALAEKHGDFLLQLADWLPRLKIAETKVTALGGGVFRLTVKVVNTGHLPTQPAISKTAEHSNPVQLKLDLPEGVSLVTGHPRHLLGILTGNGGSAEQTWLLRGPTGKAAKIKIIAYAAAAGLRIDHRGPEMNPSGGRKSPDGRRLNSR